MKEKSKLLADFMQQKYVGEYGWHSDDYFKNALEDNFGDILECEYHSSYEWLMPVWKKFRDLDIKEDGYNKLAHMVHCGKIRIALCDETIKETFELLSEAIEWYNTIK